jgi:hypothetical protein
MPTPAPALSPRPEDNVKDVDETGVWSGAFDWKKDVGLPEDATPKEELEFKVKHMEESLNRLDELERQVKNQ